MSRRGAWDTVSWLTVLGILSVWRGCLCACPWDRQGLVRWSEAGTWPNNQVPRENDKVEIPTGKHVLLDVQPATLATLTIDSRASLIWGDVDGLILRTHYIIVRGEFRIGSEKCRFEKKANIQLVGRSNSEHKVSENIGTKVIAVPAGGVLELHGKHKTSWTKLAQTIPASHSVHCGFVYNHADHEKFPIGREGQAGLHVMVWQEDGNVFDFVVFKHTYSSFRDFFKTIPDGKVIGIFAYGSDGPVGRTTHAQEVAEVKSLIRELGGVQISKIQRGDSYSFLARKGDPSSAKERHKTDGQKHPDPVSFLHLRDEERGLDFQVAASSGVRLELFRVQRTEVAYPILTLAEEVTGWEPGDEIVVTSTDFDWRQAEVRTIIPCPTCSARQVRVDASFHYMHYGNFTYDVDERAEVGMLTRSIKIEGLVEPACYAFTKTERTLCERLHQDTFGGHIMIFKGHAAVHIEGVELYHMGQQNRLAAYPIHFHMCGDVSGSWIRDNSIHHTFSRCVTIHGTHNAEVTGNVCYDFIGHGYFLEDGVEQNNTLVGNLGLGARHGTLLMSDMTKDWCQKDYGKQLTKSCDELSVFWITHPNNVLTDNSAAGGDGHGYAYMCSMLPLGLSYQVPDNFPHNARFYPLKQFDRNIGHSNNRMGIWMDSKISTGRMGEAEDGIPENGIIQEESDYDPHEPPNEFGQRVWVEIRRCTFYKNGFNMWVKGGNIRVVSSTLADAPEGFGGGTTGTETGTEVFHCLFIGETDNLGVPWKGTIRVGEKEYPGIQLNRSYHGYTNEALTAVSMYQGPNFIKSSYFNRYKNVHFCVTEDCSQTAWRHAGALSWKRDNTYPTMTSSYLKDLKFGYCDGDDDQLWLYHGDSNDPSWGVEEDGNLMAWVRDADGSVTGGVNASILRPFPMYMGDECVNKSAWQMSVCPYRYIKMEIVGKDGSLSKEKQDKYPVFMSRDDPPYTDPFIVQGTIRNEYLLRVSMSYVLEFNSTLPGAEYPSAFTVFGYGVEKGMVVRVGICQPKDVGSFDIRMDYPAYVRRDPVWVHTLTELDADTTGGAFFYDRTRGILFFKILSHHQRTNDSQQCPAGKCFKFTVKLVGGSRHDVRSCISKNNRPPPFVDNSPTPQKPTGRKCTKPDSPEGMGSVQWNEIAYISRQPLSVPCAQPPKYPGRGSVENVGCYLTKYQQHFGDTVELYLSMTPQYCADRCYKRNYKYAGLWRGRRCSCSNQLNADAQRGTDCRKACSGDGAKSCGGDKSYSVYSTGLA